MAKHKGRCHCGAIRFQVEAPDVPECLDCNCSVCRMTGFLHLIVPRSRFELLSGEDQLTCYTFNTGVAQHTFCRVCGVKPFYTPRSNPDGVSVNVRCLDPQPEFRVVPFDGDRWEENASDLEHLSKESG